MYTQNDEEEHILKHLAGIPAGRFYDIGAWNGVQFSNTLALLERGWSGVSVEPEFESFRALITNLAPHLDRLSLVNAAVATTSTLAPFWSSHGDAVSTLDPAHRDKWSDAIGGMRKYFIKTLPISELFSTFGPAEFISLDVEGTNWELFQQLPFYWTDLKLIVVEHDSRIEEMCELAARFDFKPVHTTSENLILAR
jgi:FkbM family methyltransferase